MLPFDLPPPPPVALGAVTSLRSEVAPQSVAAGEGAALLLLVPDKKTADLPPPLDEKVVVRQTMIGLGLGGMGGGGAGAKPPSEAAPGAVPILHAAGSFAGGGTRSRSGSTISRESGGTMPLQCPLCSSSYDDSEGSKSKRVECLFDPVIRSMLTSLYRSSAPSARAQCASLARNACASDRWASWSLALCVSRAWKRQRRRLRPSLSVPLWLELAAAPGTPLLRPICRLCSVEDRFRLRGHRCQEAAEWVGESRLEDGAKEGR